MPWQISSWLPTINDWYQHDCISPVHRHPNSLPELVDGLHGSSSLNQLYLPYYLHKKYGFTWLAPWNKMYLHSLQATDDYWRMHFWYEPGCGYCGEQFLIKHVKKTKTEWDVIFAVMHSIINTRSVCSPISPYCYKIYELFFKTRHYVFGFHIMMLIIILFIASQMIFVASRH